MFPLKDQELEAQKGPGPLWFPLQEWALQLALALGSLLHNGLQTCSIYFLVPLFPVCSRYGETVSSCEEQVMPTHYGSYQKNVRSSRLTDQIWC